MPLSFLVPLLHIFAFFAYKDFKKKNSIEPQNSTVDVFNID